MGVDVRRNRWSVVHAVCVVEFREFAVHPSSVMAMESLGAKESQTLCTCNSESACKLHPFCEVESEVEVGKKRRIKEDGKGL